MPWVFLEDLHHVFGDGDGALLPVFGQEAVLGLCGDVHLASGEVEVGPVEGLEFSAPEAGCEDHGKKGLLPVGADGEEFLELCVGVGDGFFAESGEAGDFFYRVVDFELVEEVVEDHPIGVEGGAGVASLGLAPGKKLLDILRGDEAGVGLGGHKLGKDPQDVVVLLVGKLLSESLDVLQEVLNRVVEVEGFLWEAGDREAGFGSFKLKALPALGFKGFGGGGACGLPFALTVHSPLGQVPAFGGTPLDAAACVTI